MYTCSLYVPGYMKIDCEVESFGRALMAAVRVLYSPEVVVPARTTLEPEGGEVLDAAKTTSRTQRQMKSWRRAIPHP